MDASLLASLADYYEYTMADMNVVAGIEGRTAVFNAAVRQLRKHKVVWEDAYESDGTFAVLHGERIEFREPHLSMAGSHNDQTVEPDNYLLNMGLEQVLAYLTNWEAGDRLTQFFADKGLSHQFINYMGNHRKLDLTVDAIPEGFPIFAYEPQISVRGSFELAQFPESLILGTLGYQTAVATNASYLSNILAEFNRSGIVTLEGGSRRLYPGAALPASRSAIAGGFKGTSLVALGDIYPELKYRVGGSSGHSAIIHIGTDEQAFEMQLRAYYRINEGDSDSVIREKIRNTKGVGPTFLIDTFDSRSGLEAAISVMKKYGIQSQVRQDSDLSAGKLKSMRMAFNDQDLPTARIMISDDLKNWKLYDLLKQDTPFDVILMGTYAVNPYNLPGAAYKIAADQRDLREPNLTPMCKVCLDNPAKGTLPGEVDTYRVISHGYADRDLILLRKVDNIRDFMQPGEDFIQLNMRVIDHGELVYDVPDMCQLIEFTQKQLALLKPEHKKFTGATPYPVVTSPAIKNLQRAITAQYAQGSF